MTEVSVVPPPALEVSVQGEPNPRVEVSVVPRPPEVVEVRVPGPAGPPGPPGIRGEPGLGGDAYYTHTQDAPQAVWLVSHGLGKYPSISVVDSAGTLVGPDIEYVDINNIQITSASPFSGRAFLS